MTREPAADGTDTARAPLPPMPPGHPVLGHLLQRWRDPLGLFSRSQQTLGDIVRYRMGSIFVEQFTHPDHVGHVLVQAKDVYVKGTVWDKLKPLIGTGVVTADGEDWRRQRRLTQPAFHHDNLTALATTMLDSIAATLHQWRRADGPVPVFRDLRAMTLQVVIRALFGTELDGDLPAISAAFVRALEVSNRRIVSPAPYAPLLYRIPTPGNLAFTRAERYLRGTVRTIIERRRQDATSHSLGHPLSGPEAVDRRSADLLDALIEAQLSEEHTLSPDLLRAEVMTFLLAGFETSATTMTWAMAFLAAHPGVWDRLRGETSEVLGGRPPSAADLPRLAYARAVVEETLRLRPALWAIPRMAVRDDLVGGFRIPRGDLVVVVPYVTHRHPEFWPDPERFDPDRFLPGRRQEIARWAYLPFGAGQRQCLGRDFALMEGQLFLACLAQSYERVEPVGGPVEPDPYVTLRPRGEVWMRVRPGPAARPTQE